MVKLYNSLNVAFTKYVIFHRLLSIDESMLPYLGRHGYEIFISKTPIRFGNEIWSICSANGYPYSLVKLHRRNEILLSNKTESKIMNIITEYSEPRKHEFYFDRL